MVAVASSLTCTMSTKEGGVNEREAAHGVSEREGGRSEWFSARGRGASENGLSKRPRRDADI